MASRKEEKERLRREREEAERAAAASANRRRMLAAVAGGVALVAAVVVIAIVALGGDDNGGNGGNGGDDTTASLPPTQTTDFDEAVEASGCRFREFESEGEGHTSADVEYQANPPHSGAHDPEWAQDGIYESGPPDLEQSVHALEHGRVNIQYRPGTPQRRIDQLEALVNEDVRGTEGWHTLLFENQSDMNAAVAITSWTRSLTCPQFTDGVFDAFRAFRLNAVLGGEWEGDIPEPNVP
jgi:hypothetical protein